MRIRQHQNSRFDEAGVPNYRFSNRCRPRRFDALKLWMSTEALGQEQYAAIIDHGVTLAQQVASLCEKEQPALELVMQPQLASVLFPLPWRVRADDAGIALLNQKVVMRCWSRPAVQTSA